MPDEVLDLLPFIAASPRAADPAVTVRRLHALCRDLGLGDALAASRRLLARGEEIEQAARVELDRAQRRYGIVYQAVLDGSAEVGELAGVLVVEAPWLAADVPGGQAAPAMSALMRAAQDARGRAAAALQAEAATIYQQLQQLADDVVRAVEAQPPIAASVWSSADPALQAIRSNQAGVWAELVRQADTFNKIHQAGQIIRESGGMAGEAMLQIAAPEALAWIWRKWWGPAERLAEIRSTPPPLRLPLAIREGWEPGLWRRSDIPDAPTETVPERGLRDRLFGWVAR
jgi:hypothetical protein